jgi:glycosyltransferase involved in cell wall biosynthesis
MRILIETSCRGVVGGLETYLQVLIPALLERGHHVALVFDFPNTSEASVDPPQAKLQCWLSGDLRKDPSLWEELARWRPDIVYSHGLESVDVERALQQKYPVVYFAHSYRGTCATGRKCHAFPGVHACNRSFGPACLALHYPRRCGGLSPIGAWKAYSSQNAFHSLLARYRAVLVASRHMQAELARNGVSPDRLHLTPLPVAEAELYSSKPTPKSPQGKLLFIGRLLDVKGVDRLIEAVPKAAAQLARSLSLTIAGEGSEKEKLEALACRLGVAAEFTGWVNATRRQTLMREADLVAVPSLWPEPFGLVGIEAGCLGVPAVGYALGGITDWLIPGQTGELAPGDPPTVDGLASSIVRALSDPKHYQSLCIGAWEHARQFSLNRHIGQLERIFEAVQAPSRSSVALSQSVPVVNHP